MRVPRLTLRDWVGDDILIVVGGAVIVAAVFLPWANEPSRGRVNFALGHPASIKGALATDYGPPVLALGVGVIAAGERAAPSGGQTPAGDSSSLESNDATRGDTNR